MTKPCILVVDDEPNGRRMLEILLSRLGCEVLSAADGKSALKQLGERAIDLIITDINMPELDGLSLLAALKAKGIATPVILVTAYGTDESAVTALNQGAFDYLVRPLCLDRVESVVRKALESQ
ncbi:response regulator [Methylococcus mesophilus]|uniref:response regulator n=1 Tax=Methylococcus mesophilus TaxID=2993564 RepID=UPI00224B083E|nr:response regulator [Methylococcus mesophilus]UZR27612.1 response regulator [Methylococcus mesophilus]